MREAARYHRGRRCCARPLLSPFGGAVVIAAHYWGAGEAAVPLLQSAIGRLPTACGWLRLAEAYRLLREACCDATAASRNDAYAYLCLRYAEGLLSRDSNNADADADAPIAARLRRLHAQWRTSDAVELLAAERLALLQRHLPAIARHGWRGDGATADPVLAERGDRGSATDVPLDGSPEAFERRFFAPFLRPA